MTKFQSKPYRFKNYKEFFDKSYGSIDKEMVGIGMIKRHGLDEGSALPSSRGMVPMDLHLLAEAHVRDLKIMEELKDLMGNYTIF